MIFTAMYNGYKILIGDHTIRVVFNNVSFLKNCLYVDNCRIVGYKDDIAFLVNYMINNSKTVDELLPIIQRISQFKEYTETQKKWVSRLCRAIESNTVDGFLQYVEKIYYRTLKINEKLRVYYDAYCKFTEKGYAITQNGFIFEDEGWFNEYGCLIYNYINDKITIKKGYLQPISLGKMIYNKIIEPDKFEQNLDLKSVIKNKSFNKALEEYPLRNQLMPHIIANALHE